LEGNLHRPVENEYRIVSHVNEVMGVHQTASHLFNGTQHGIFWAPVFRRLKMQTVNTFAHNRLVAFIFYPVHDKGIFVGVQFLRDFYFLDEVATNESIVGPPSEGKTLVGYPLLYLYKPSIMHVWDDVNVYTPNRPDVSSDIFTGISIPVFAEDNVAISEHEPLSSHTRNTFFSGFGA